MLKHYIRIFAFKIVVMICSSPCVVFDCYLKDWKLLLQFTFYGSNKNESNFYTILKGIYHSIYKILGFFFGEKEKCKIVHFDKTFSVSCAILGIGYYFESRAFLYCMVLFIQLYWSYKLKTQYAFKIQKRNEKEQKYSMPSDENPFISLLCRSSFSKQSSYHCSHI